MAGRAPTANDGGHLHGSLEEITGDLLIFEYVGECLAVDDEDLVEVIFDVLPVSAERLEIAGLLDLII